MKVLRRPEPWVGQLPLHLYLTSLASLLNEQKCRRKPPWQITYNLGPFQASGIQPGRRKQALNHKATFGCAWPRVF